MNKEQQDIYYLKIAQIVSENSYCERLKVGSVIIKDNRIISEGFNGSISGFPNVCEVNDRTLPEVLHSESNALMKCLRNGSTPLLDSIIYCTHAPCIECAKLIIQAGIKEVIYINDYRSVEGIQLLKKAGLKVIQKQLPSIDRDFKIVPRTSYFRMLFKLLLERFKKWL
jgi:dCMP deaminase